MSIHPRTTRRTGTTWVVRWRDPRPRERTFRTKLEAERFERTIRHQLDSGTYRDPVQDQARFGEWAERWWRTVEASDRAANTKVQYETILRRHVLPAVTTATGTAQFSPGLGDRRLVSLRRIDLEEWLAALAAAGRGASTIRTARTIAGMVLESAARSGVLRTNPLAGVRVTRRAGTNARKVITPEQVELLADAMGTGRPGYRELVLLLGYGGLRPNEALALRRRHLDDVGNVLVADGMVEVRGHLIETDGKTHRCRTVTLPPSVGAELHEHVARNVGADPEALVFTTPGGQPLRLRNFRRLFSQVVSSAGLPAWVTPYTLRHTCASLLARQGVHPAVAADILGHDPAVYLRTYAHLYPEDRARAATALDAARPTGSPAGNRPGPFATRRGRSSRGDDAETAGPDAQ